MIPNDFPLNPFLIAIIAIVLWITLNYMKSPKHMPPGPKGIPFLGYLPFLGRKPHLVLNKLKEKYGDIFTIYIPHERIVVLSSFKLIKEVFQQSDNYTDRPHNLTIIMNYGSQEGILGSGDSPRKELRRFALNTLKNLGMGKASLEPKIQDEIQFLIKNIKSLDGKPTYFREMLKTSITNIICTIMYGERMDYETQNFQQLIQLSNDYVTSLGIDQWSQYLPEWIDNVLGITNPVDVGTLVYKKMLDEVQKYDKIHKSINNQQSFIDFWRTEAEKPNTNKACFNEKKLAKILSELFIAGSDTTSTTLEWALLYMTKYPQVQAKVQMEIDEVIGKDRLPAMSDQTLMPYTQATILELSRTISLVPLLLPHKTSEDTTLAGYFIPKNTTIFANAWAVHNNPELFPEPERFKPERFLTEDYKVKHVEELLPFSIGKRQCIGEALARMQMFLYLTTLLQQFLFTSETTVSLECHFSVVLQPVLQYIYAIKR